MNPLAVLLLFFAIAPALLMLSGAVFFRTNTSDSSAQVWQRFRRLSAGALVSALLASTLMAWLTSSEAADGALDATPWLTVSGLSLLLALLVQFLGTVIGVFSSRYLQGEPRQPLYASALSGVLASVHLLLLADHWLILIGAWAAVGLALGPLLCFYPERPFARLAAHKKRIADRLADALLLAAAALAWTEVGTGALSDLWAYLAEQGGSAALQASAVCLALAVILRTALFPLHGWLNQVMEAPTPVSALLHAGVVNLGGFVLIRFAPLIEAADAARWLLVTFGLLTALFAGMVMLTRVSIKVRLAWSTIAQMGFMVLECGLGLYTLAALHLIGHSLYKAHAFLSASSIVRTSRLHALRDHAATAPLSLILAPALSLGIVMFVHSVFAAVSWPWWWNGVLALAWAPLLWLPAPARGAVRESAARAIAGIASLAGLTAVAALAQLLPVGVSDAPNSLAGYLTLSGMALLYLGLVMLQWRPRALETWRRLSYAGFYVDEIYTRVALCLWPTRWTAPTKQVRLPGTEATEPLADQK